MNPQRFNWISYYCMVIHYRDTFQKSGDELSMTFFIYTRMEDRLNIPEKMVKVIIRHISINSANFESCLPIERGMKNYK